MKTNLTQLLLALGMIAVCLLPSMAQAQQQQPPAATSGDATTDEFNRLKGEMTQQIDQLEKDMSAATVKVNDSVDKAETIEKEYIDAVAKSADDATLKAISVRYGDAVTEAINQRAQFITQAEKSSAALNQTMKVMRNPKYTQLVESDIDAIVVQIGRLQKVFEPVRKVDGVAQKILTRMVAALIAMPTDQREKLTDQQLEEEFQKAARSVLESKAH